MAEQDWKKGLSERHIGQIIRRKMMEKTHSSKRNYNRNRLKQLLKSYEKDTNI